MKVVLPIAAILAIMIAAGVFGGSKPTDRAPVDLEDAPAPVAASVTLREAAGPVAFDPYTGWGVADLQHGVADSGPEAVLPLIEVDPFDRYGVAAQPVPLARTVTDSWDWTPVSFADVRALYEDALPMFAVDPVPAAAPATGAWWETVPLDAK